MNKKANGFLELYKAGNSLKEIAALYNISRERVRQILTSHPNYIARDKKASINLYYEKIGISKHDFHGFPLTTCVACGGKVSTTHQRLKREHCAKCWIKHTTEGRAYNAWHNKQSRMRRKEKDL